MIEPLVEVHEMIRALAHRARELGWEIETNWRDSDDEQESYDLYAWPRRRSEGTDTP